MKSLASRLPAKSRAISLTIFGFCLCLLLLASLSFTSRPATAKAEDKAENKDATNSFTRTETRVVPPVDESADPHVLAAAYYRIGNHLHTTLMLNNKSPQPAEARVALFSLSGERLDLLPVMVAGNSFSEIDLREQIGDNPAFQGGSLQVFYRGHDLMLGSQVKMVDEARSLIFDEQLVEPAAMFASSKLEGVWWLPSPRSDVRLAVSNTTDAPLTVTARVDAFAPSQRETFRLTLAPHETRLFEWPRTSDGRQGGTLSKVGGISLEHTGTPGALLARGFVSHPSTGHSSSVHFSDPGKSKSSTLHGAGLRLGRVGGDELTPIIVARNNGDTETVITGRIPYTANDGSASVLMLPRFRLSAGETKQLHLTAALRSGHLPQNLKSAGVEFAYTGAPGSVVMSAQSVNRDGNGVFRVPLLDPLAQKSATGGYPWSIEGDSATAIYIKNVTDHEQQYVLQFNYAGGASPEGTYTLGMKSLAAGQTELVDIRALRDRQTPDIHGRTLPPDTARGQVQWSMRGGEKLVLIGRSEQADTVRGLASTYACQNCCPNNPYDLACLPDTLMGFPGDTSQLDLMAREWSCYGNIFDPYPVSGNDWFSLNEAVATVSGGSAAAQGVGSTQLYGRWYTWSWLHDPQVGTCDSYPDERLASAVCDVLALRTHRGRIQAQGSNPRVEVSIAWSQDNVPSKATALSWLDSVWDRLTSSQKRDRQRAYEDARRFIQDAPQDGYEAFPNRISRSFQDPQRRDPSARIDIEIITGRAFEGPF